MRLFPILSAAALALSLLPASAATYAPDPGHTGVRAAWNHAGLSQQALNFRKVAGTVDLGDDIAAAKVNITIDLTGIDTGVEALDQHLASGDFFDVAKFGTASFVSTAVEKTGETTAKVTGDLTIKGVTKPVTLDVTLNHKGPHPFGQMMEYFKGEWIGITATGTIKRSDWGLGLFVPAVSDEVQIFISSEMKAQ